MDFKYVPVLKNRPQELAVLKILFKLPISNSVLPLIEIVQEKSNVRSRAMFYDEIQKINETNMPVMVDIVRVNNPKGTKPNIKEFLINNKNNFEHYINLYKQLKEIPNLIPVVSYDPDDYNINDIKQTSNAIKSIGFTKIAYRLKWKSKTFLSPLSEIANIINSSDILLFDIGHTGHSSSILKDPYNKINKLRSKKDFISVIINSTIPKNLKNTDLINGQKIEGLDCALQKAYSVYGFNAFGDYACVKSELPPSGGTISPGFIFYCSTKNCYIGYKGRIKKLTEFKDHIVPELLKSSYWHILNRQHKENCPGCNIIKEVHNGLNEGKSQGMWKRVSMLHYIYTMDELL